MKTTKPDTTHDLFLKLLGMEAGEMRAAAKLLTGPQRDILVNALLDSMRDLVIQIQYLPGCYHTGKISAIKAYREASGFGLKEAKEAIEAADGVKFASYEVKQRWLDCLPKYGVRVREDGFLVPAKSATENV